MNGLKILILLVSRRPGIFKRGSVPRHKPTVEKARHLISFEPTPQGRCCGSFREPFAFAVGKMRRQVH